MTYWLECWKKYVAFSGRARRKEYWMFFLFNLIITFAIGFVLGLVGAPEAASGVGTLYSLAAFLPGLAVACRRLHDTGKSGWWFLIVLVPFIGAIVFLVFMCQDSQPGANEYGANPKNA